MSSQAVQLDDVVVSEPTASADEAHPMHKKHPDMLVGSVDLQSAGVINQFSNYIWVKNETGETLVVYTRSAPSQRLKELDTNVGREGVNFKLILEQLDLKTTSADMVEANRGPVKIEVKGDTYLSIRRGTSEDGDWYCFNKLVRSGRIATVPRFSMAAPLHKWLPPAGAPSTS